jgi:8-oxo-dGTP pyrophosphatase MutT (NUDIX family)
MSPQARFSTRNQVSAGGAAFRRVDDQVEVALISVGETRRWQLPKGMVDEGETPEAAAQREVREEAGLETELIELLDKIEYWYFAKGGAQRVRFHKFVYFFLLHATGGDVSQHDHEVNEARWFPIAEAVQILAFENERKVVQRAQTRIEEIGRQT